MRRIFTAVFCAASVGLMALAQPAIAQQKTAKQCNDEWAADRAAIQASGKTKRVFVAECRGVPVPTAATPRTMALSKGQYTTEAEAKASCPKDAIVWANLRSKVYHASDSRYYGKTQQGAYMCEPESIAAGYHAPRYPGAGTAGAATGGAPSAAKDGAT
jgi:hypothetical protein